MGSPLIIAHRGAPGRKRENTIPGFLAGIAHGAEWIELDLHQTADGGLIVYHDFMIGAKPVAACTLEQAKRLARRVRKIELPTLDQVLEAIPGSIGLGVEIKAPSIGPAVAATLARHHAAERAICSSFHLPTVQSLADLTPRIRSGVLSASRLRDPANKIRRLRAEAIFQEYHLVDQGYVNTVRKAGFGFFVWTVNRQSALARMIELEVDGIITDYPERLLRLREARQEIPSATTKPPSKR